MTDPSPTPIAPVFTIAEDGSARLLGGRCGSCATVVFPQPARCPACASAEVGPVVLGAEGGRLRGWTFVHTPPPGYEGPVPYGFGYVELAEGIVVLGRITPGGRETFDLRYDQPMRCVIDEVGRDEDGAAMVAWAFAPVSPGPEQVIVF
jgi:uncharacterized OB-fold protein